MTSSRGGTSNGFKQAASSVSSIVTARTCSSHLLLSMGDKTHRHWNVSPCMACPLLAWDRAWVCWGCGCLVGRLVWMISPLRRVSPKRCPLWGSPELWLLPLFHTSGCDFPAPLSLLPYLTTALLCSCSGSAFPRIQPGLQEASQMTWTLRLIRKITLTSPSTALKYRCILSELANQIEFLSPVQVIRRLCC